MVAGGATLNPYVTGISLAMQSDHVSHNMKIIKRTAVHLGGGGGGVLTGGVVDEGAREGPTCPLRPTIFLRQDPLRDDGGVVYRQARTWAPWYVCCPRDALLGAARLDASARLTAPVFCNKRNPCYSQVRSLLVGGINRRRHLPFNLLCQSQIYALARPRFRNQ